MPAKGKSLKIKLGTWGAIVGGFLTFATGTIAYVTWTTAQTAARVLGISLC